MASCLMPDFPAVLVALEHLCELDKQLKDEGVSFSQEASHHLREISAAITELEKSRKAVHDQLEVETIETSKLRHQVLSIRDDITNEISAGVAAARDVNAFQLNTLQAELTNIMQDIEFMDKKQDLLVNQNAVLFPERELVKRNHEDVIDQLNYQLSEKANKQIVLNETMNEIREVTAKISNVESAKEDLEENMTEERKTFAETKKTIEKEIEESINDIQEQKKATAKTRRELDMVASELMDKNDKVTEHKNHITQLERSVARLTASETRCKEQLEEEINKKEELDQQKQFHEKELLEVREAFEQKVQSLQEKISEVEREMDEGREVNGVHLESIAELSNSFKLQRKEEDDVMAEHHNLSRRLEKSKLRLEERIASIAKYKIEIREMDEEMKQLHDTNIVNAELFQRNLEELQGQLAKEKKSRATIEVDRDELCQSLEGLKEDHEQHMKEVISAIETTQGRYEELCIEERKLQDHIFMGAVIQRLTREIKHTEKACKRSEVSIQEDIQKLTADAEAIMQSRLEKEEELKVQGSILGEVEAQFDIDQARHQTLKKHTTELRTTKNRLELSIQEVMDNTAALLKPREERKQELKTLRASHIELLTAHATEISATEKTIYDNGLMLEQVNMENSRLHLCIEQMKEDILNARKDKGRHTQDIGWLKLEVQSLFRSLLDAWETDTAITEKATEKDKRILEEIHSLMARIQDRERRLGHVNGRLTEELAVMSYLLEHAKP